MLGDGNFCPKSMDLVKKSLPGSVTKTKQTYFIVLRLWENPGRRTEIWIDSYEEK